MLVLIKGRQEQKDALDYLDDNAGEKHETVFSLAEELQVDNGQNDDDNAIDGGAGAYLELSQVESVKGVVIQEVRKVWHQTDQDQETPKPSHDTYLYSSLELRPDYFQSSHET